MGSTVQVVVSYGVSRDISATTIETVEKALEPWLQKHPDDPNKYPEPYRDDTTIIFHTYMSGGTIEGFIAGLEEASKGGWAQLYLRAIEWGTVVAATMVDGELQYCRTLEAPW